ncbi:ATP-dependent Clp protease ATP-binding subunit CLPT1, chloroplastic-like [Quillaja saponaria]|uniref:ATP-dependent Clp protease ATP-binding subunit CLPT1, chloroplastic-like n=1 Tax=Quillaja saponaria TaxID=32244 RepID=A0AAD7VH54_QUISA|nr:ATP-dependent Clp protease ATP-binding subunit CLPT1, chloroplastic-like [Quillaja saponaria]
MNAGGAIYLNSSHALQSCSSKPKEMPNSLTLSSLFGTKLRIQGSYSFRFIPSKHCRATTATVSFSLPTAKPQRDTSEKLPKWSARSIKSFVLGELEARKLKYPNTGTESLLMGILVEGTSIAAKFLRASGITLFKVREETVELLGKSDMYFFSPEHPPLTEPAQKALDWAVDEKLKSGEGGEITTTHLLLGIWSEEESAGHRIMASLGFDDEKAKELAKSINEEVDLSFKKAAQETS